MRASTLSEAYIKCIQSCTVERMRLGIPISAMADRLGVYSNRLSNLEKLKSIDVRLLDEYMMEFNFKIKSIIEKD